LADVGWYKGNSGWPDVGPHPVAQKLPNNWGLYDMHGNVWEWCEDFTGPYPTAADAVVIDPKGPLHGGETGQHVLRGGSWATVEMRCRSAQRAAREPTSMREIHGLRFCVDPPTNDGRAKIKTAAAAAAAGASSAPATEHYVQPPGKVVELLPLIDPAHPSPFDHHGSWSRQGSDLVTPGRDSNGYDMPYVVPQEYDYIIEFTRHGGHHHVAQIFPNPLDPLQKIWWGMGFSFNHYFGLLNVNGKGLPAAENPTSVKAPSLQDEHRYTSVVQVRRRGVRTYLDGKLMLDWKTDFHELSDPYPGSMKNPGQPGVIVYDCAVTIHRIAIIEVTGRGKLLQAASKPPPQPPLGPAALVTEPAPLPG
jgi:hypothetical protein